MSTDRYKVIEIYYPALNTYTYLYNGVEYDNMNDAELAKTLQEIHQNTLSMFHTSNSKIELADYLSTPKHRYNNVEYGTLIEAQIARHTDELKRIQMSGNNMFDFRTMNDEDWEYLSEMNRARDEAQAAATGRKPECKEHQWVNISLLSVKEVCKVCDVERKEGDK